MNRPLKENKHIPVACLKGIVPWVYNAYNLMLHRSRMDSRSNNNNSLAKSTHMYSLSHPESRTTYKSRTNFYSAIAIPLKTTSIKYSPPHPDGQQNPTPKKQWGTGNLTQKCQKGKTAVTSSGFHTLRRRIFHWKCTWLSKTHHGPRIRPWTLEEKERNAVEQELITRNWGCQPQESTGKLE